MRAGDIIAYHVEEPHGMRAEEEALVIAAVIAPRPRGTLMTTGGARRARDE